MIKLALTVILSLIVASGIAIGESTSDKYPYIKKQCDVGKALSHAQALEGDKKDYSLFFDFISLVDELKRCHKALGEVINDKEELDRIRKVIREKKLISKACPDPKERDQWDEIVNK